MEEWLSTEERQPGPARLWLGPEDDAVEVVQIDGGVGHATQGGLCARGTACPLSDCPQVHPERPDQCRVGGQCTIGRACPFLHPAAWYTGLGDHQPAECVHGMACFNFERCRRAHPAAWYLDRCPEGPNCRFSDCPHAAHPRCLLPCFKGPECSKTVEECSNFAHPQAWYLQRGAAAGAPGAAPTPAPLDRRLRLDCAQSQALILGGLLFVCRAAARHRVTAHIVGSDLVLRGAAPDVAEEDVMAEVNRLALRTRVRTEVVPISDAQAGRLAAGGPELLRLLARDLGVGLEVVAGGICVSAPGGDLPKAQERLAAVLADPAPVQAQLRSEAQDTVDMFVDNSNLSISSRMTSEGKDFAIRLHIQNLVDAMQGVRQVGRRVVAGSLSQTGRDTAIWKRWADAGFEVKTTSQGPRGREFLVDQCLVAEALMHVTDKFMNGAPAGVLVLGTGDGNLEGQLEGNVSANFRNLVTKVCQFGWRVEIWTWRFGCSRRYFAMAEEPAFRDRLKVCFLDGLRDFVTFRQVRSVPEAAATAPEGEPVASDQDGELEAAS